MILIQHTSLALVNFKQWKSGNFFCLVFHENSVSDHKFSFRRYGHFSLFFPPSSAIESELNGKSFSYIYSREGEAAKKQTFIMGRAWVRNFFLFACPVIKLQIPSPHQWRINWKFSRDRAMRWLGWEKADEECFLILNPTLISFNEKSIPNAQLTHCWALHNFDKILAKFWWFRIMNLTSVKGTRKSSDESFEL